VSCLTAIKALAAGNRPHGEILPPCRMEAHGVEFHGEEAIVEAFRNAPLTLGGDAVSLETDRHVAIIGDEAALIADVYGSNIARLWRLGPGEPLSAEPALAVPFDADLMQSRGDSVFRLEDHPQLSLSGSAALEEAGRRLARDWSPAEGQAPYRVRAFLIRAFSSGPASVGLFAVYRMSGGAIRASGFSYAAVLLQGGGTDAVVVRDRAGEAAIGIRPWTPRVDSPLHADAS
jgi:hypothetical protein